MLKLTVRQLAAEDSGIIIIIIFNSIVFLLDKLVFGLLILTVTRIAVEVMFVRGISFPFIQWICYPLLTQELSYV